MTRLIDSVCRSLDINRGDDGGAASLLAAEWLITNGLGGYASGTVAGVATRRYHGLLVAALPNPLGRTIVLNHLGERAVIGDREPTSLGGEERVAGRLDPEVAKRIKSFSLVAGLPVWRYDLGGVEIEKRLFMPHGQNTVIIRYCLIGGAEHVSLDLVPAVHFRSYEAPVSAPINTRYVLTTSGGYRELGTDPPYPSLRMQLVGCEEKFVADERLTSEFVYPVEEARGYEFRGALWAPGHFSLELTKGEPVALVASTESEDVMSAIEPNDVIGYELERRRRLLRMAHPSVQDPMSAELVLAADQFVFTPVGRVKDTVRANASGDEIRSVIAGYHWFTDWGRDTMISLEGLTLVTGRWREAGYILRTFAHYVKDGLIPNMFPDGSNEGLYHTCDATLWFFHAMERYVQTTGDRSTLVQLLPTLEAIVAHHVQGTRFGIHVDPRDGLLTQGAEGYQLTWMDAKVDDWVVTPRRGKAVEINALWYNALCLLQQWLAEERGPAAARGIAERAQQARESFNARFPIDGQGYLYDIVDGERGNNAQCRPNQIFAISLDHPVLDRSRWESVVDVVRQRLLTPVGLRSLAPGDPEYKERYYGDLRARDAAYHQGTVWAWLIGPWIDAWLRVHPDDRQGARRYLDGCLDALGEFGIGTIGEIFDAESPYAPRGCIAQAWSVAEVLRCLVKVS